MPNENRVDSIFNTIYDQCKDSCSYEFNLSGDNVEKIFEELDSEYKNNIAPKIDELSVEEKERLLLELQVLFNSKDISIERKVLEDAINHISESLDSSKHL